MDIQKKWKETVERRPPLRDRVKSFFWFITHPVMTARLAHFAVKVLGKDVLDYKNMRR